MQGKFDPNVSGPVTVVAAFQGWNDVAGAAYDAVDHAVTVTKATKCAEIDPQGYYDFQVNQPRLDVVDGVRTIVWRTTTLFHAHLDEIGDVIFVRGIEPSFRWLDHLTEILDALAGVKVSRFLTLGALPGEVAHTRPFPVTRTSAQEPTRAIYNAQPPTYVGPIGFVGVFIDAVNDLDAESLSLWCQVPQYTTGGTQPKATAALVRALGDVLGRPLQLGTLEEQSEAWERGVAELVRSDPQTRSYVEGLEHAYDVQEHPNATGDAIASEFEQFLRRRENE